MCTCTCMAVVHTFLHYGLREAPTWRRRGTHCRTEMYTVHYTHMYTMYVGGACVCLVQLTNEIKSCGTTVQFICTHVNYTIRTYTLYIYKTMCV